MADKEPLPVTPTTVKALTDKLYDKRKNAGLEIEKTVRELQVAGNSVQLEKLLNHLSKDLASSLNHQKRKGGLMGLAAFAIGLGKESSKYVSQLIEPSLACFSDTDHQIRYYACESLYNIVKVIRGPSLQYFNKIFDGLYKLSDDAEVSCRSGSELLSRLLMDVVAESSSFDLVSFIPILRDRLYTRKPFPRQFLLTWLMALDSVPDIEMIVFLPDILDGLLLMMADRSADVSKTAEATLSKLLTNVRNDPGKVNFPAIINIVITHSQAAEDSLQFMSLQWLKEIVSLGGRSLLPFVSGILLAILPCLSFDQQAKSGIRNTAQAINDTLLGLILPEDDDDDVVDKELPAGGSKPDAESTSLNMSALLTSVGKHMCDYSVASRTAALNWIKHLIIQTPRRIFHHMPNIFLLLLQSLKDPSEEVVLLALEALAKVCSSPAGNQTPDQSLLDDLNSTALSQLAKLDLSAYCSVSISRLVQQLCADSQLLRSRGQIIVRQLCVLLDQVDMYRALSVCLLYEKDIAFASHLVRLLNGLLMTATELFPLRNLLASTESDDRLFESLFRPWCLCPVSALSLCLLAKRWNMAASMVLAFSEFEVTVDILTEVDKLVQLLESPIFTTLRLSLLHASKEPSLVTALYGLLMLLPQTEAFHLLRRRLACVPPNYLTHSQNSPGTPNKPTIMNKAEDDLIQHFRETQQGHKRNKLARIQSERVRKT